MVVNGQDGCNSLSNGSEIHCAHVYVCVCVHACEHKRGQVINQTGKMLTIGESR